jgi:uncharacterized protein YbjT (DUF2867 family)
MKAQYCIIGATHGTGLLITRQLLQCGSLVRVLVRNPSKARQLFDNRADVCPGDVTDARSVRATISAELRAIFFTVAATGGIDGRGLFASQTAIRQVTYQGLINLVDAARSTSFQGRIILPSVIGADQSSFVIRVLDKIKSGLQRNIIGRELYLRASGLDYTIVRAPILTDALAGNANIRVVRATNRLTAGPKISRGDLARVMILASQQPAASRKTFDLFSSKGVAPSDQQIVEQIERIPTDVC